MQEIIAQHFIGFAMIDILVDHDQNTGPEWQIGKINPRPLNEMHMRNLWASFDEGKNILNRQEDTAITVICPRHYITNTLPRHFTADAPRVTWSEDARDGKECWLANGNHRRAVMEQYLGARNRASIQEYEEKAYSNDGPRTDLQRAYVQRAAALKEELAVGGLWLVKLYDIGIYILLLHLKLEG